MQAFGRVLGVPHVPYLLATALVARLPYGIVGIAILFFVQEEKDSFASAGAVAAAFSIAAAVTLPVLGRVIDVRGLTRVLIVVALVQAASGAALVVLGLAGASTLALVVAAALAGGAVAPVSPALRSLWPDLIGDDPSTLRSALALDAISLEFVFVGGPLATALMIGVASPAVALVVGFALSVGGGVAFALSPPARRWRGSGITSFGLGPLASPGLRTLIAACVPIGLALGSLEVALPAFGVSEDSRSIGALAITSLALGSALGGLVYGLRPPARLVPVLIGLFAALPVGVAVLTLADSPAAVLLLAPLAGAAVAPLTAAVNELAGYVVPTGTVTEAYAWVLTATLTGFSIGTGVGGAIIEQESWREALLLGAAAGAAGTLIAFGRRRSLAV